MSEPETDRALTERALDLILYAPAGFVLRAVEDFPAMATKGRDRLGLHVRNARVVGQFVMAKGRRDLERRLNRGPRGAGPEGLVPDPGARPAPADAEALAPDPEAARVLPLRSTRADAVAVDAAIEGYDTLSASQVVRRLDSLGPEELRAVVRHESGTRNRRTILHRAQQLLGAAEAPGR